MPMDVAALLASLSLSRYLGLFRDVGLDGDALTDLTEADLLRMGLPARDRRRLLKRIEQLGVGARGVGLADAGARHPLSHLGLAAQRRQLTVMFCDLVGSTELSSRLDLEDMHEVIRTYHSCCAREIASVGGLVAKYMGDGVLAYFGYPEANEDDAQRALHAALAVTEAVQTLPTPHGAPLAVRVGVATGVVLVGDLIGDGVAQERAVVGETPNLAARLQAVAAPNRVVVSSQTRALAHGTFEFRDLGPIRLKGVATDDSVWEVLGPAALSNRFQSRHGRMSAPLVGRERDLQHLLELWRRAKAGGGQVVGLTGEAGIGKSRLVQELRREVARGAHIWLEGGSAPIFRNTPFHPVVQMIRRRLLRQGPASPDEMLARLEAGLAWAKLSDEALPLIAELIGAPTPAGPQPVALGATDRRAALLGAVADWILHSAGRWPTVLVVEDLHWADPSTLELLERLVARMEASPLLLVYTARPGFHPPWDASANGVVLNLQRLAPESARRLASAATGRAVDDALIDTLVTRADGVPLFVEELARLVSDGGQVGAERQIPTTLSDLLTARLDRVGSAKVMAQVASVLGSEFHLELLQAVSGADRSTLLQAVARLEAEEILDPRPSSEGPVYGFKHVLIRDAAYDALLRSQRRELHRRAASMISERFLDLAEAQPEVVAQHWTAAAEPERAAAAWQDAGRAASKRRAYQEAQRSYEQALALLVTLPETPERGQRELEVLSSLSGVLQITKGYSAPSTMATAERARALAEAGGHLRKQVAHMVSTWGAASSAGEYARAGSIADQLVDLAHTEGGAESLALAHMIQLTSRFRGGDLLGAEEAFAGGRSYFRGPVFVGLTGAPAQVFGNMAFNAWILDRTAEARRRMARGLTLSRRSANPYNLAFAEYMAAMVALVTGDETAAAERAACALLLSEEHRYPQFIATSRIVLGRARAALGEPAEGAALIVRGLEDMQATRSKAAATMYLTWLAEAHALAGAPDAALAAAEDALQRNPQEKFYRPESFRVRAQLHAAQGDVRQARRDLAEALSLAGGLGARLFHRRATADLANLQDTGLGA